MIHCYSQSISVANCTIKNDNVPSADLSITNDFSIFISHQILTLIVLKSTLALVIKTRYYRYIKYLAGKPRPIIKQTCKTVIINKLVHINANTHLQVYVHLCMNCLQTIAQTIINQTLVILDH